MRLAFFATMTAGVRPSAPASHERKTRPRLRLCRRGEPHAGWGAAKGGSALKIRFGEEWARATTDLDAALLAPCKAKGTRKSLGTVGIAQLKRNYSKKESLSEDGWCRSGELQKNGPSDLGFCGCRLARAAKTHLKSSDILDFLEESHLSCTKTPRAPNPTGLRRPYVVFLAKRTAKSNRTNVMPLSNSASCTLRDKRPRATPPERF